MSKYSATLFLRTGIQIFNGTFKHLISEEASSFGSGFYLFQSQNIRIFNADIENNGIRGVFAQSVAGLELTKSNIHQHPVITSFG